MKRLLIVGMMFLAGCAATSDDTITLLNFLSSVMDITTATGSMARGSATPSAYQAPASGYQPPINCVIKPPVTTSDGHRVAGAMGTNYTARCQ
jgi:hypothetical protein